MMSIATAPNPDTGNENWSEVLNQIPSSVPKIAAPAFRSHVPTVGIYQPLRKIRMIVELLLPIQVLVVVIQQPQKQPVDFICGILCF